MSIGWRLVISVAFLLVACICLVFCIASYFYEREWHYWAAGACFAIGMAQLLLGHEAVFVGNMGCAWILVLLGHCRKSSG
jgi:uncharacterized membrane protein YjjB (DUF3815 family)